MQALPVPRPSVASGNLSLKMSSQSPAASFTLFGRAGKTGSTPAGGVILSSRIEVPWRTGLS